MYHLYNYVKLHFQLLFNLFQDNYKLQSLLTNKDADFKKVSMKLNKSCELIKQYEVKLAEQKNQIETSLMKYSEESKNVSAYESNYNLLAEKLKVLFLFVCLSVGKEKLLALKQDITKFERQ